MKFHILNGDALAEKFPASIEGQKIIIREAFMEGPLSAAYSKEFWERRADFVAIAYEADKGDYENQFLTQLHLLDSIQPGDEAYLWFEDDLFCLVNMWFTVHYLSQRNHAKLFRIFPDKDDVHWSGFAKTRELQKHYNEAVLMSDEEIQLSNELWESFVNNNRERLRTLSASDTACFRFLPRVVEAHLDRNPDNDAIGRPQQTLLNILHEGKTDFYEIFEAFWKKESIYGFGDLQVLNMMKEMGVDMSESE